MLWVRLHNQIVRQLAKNKSWSSYKIFQETRKILGAMMQLITYKHYLPKILSPRTIARYWKKLSLRMLSDVLTYTKITDFKLCISKKYRHIKKRSNVFEHCNIYYFIVFYVFFSFMTCLAKKYLIYDAKLIYLKAKYRHCIQIKRCNESTFLYSYTEL